MDRQQPQQSQPQPQKRRNPWMPFVYLGIAFIVLLLIYNSMGGCGPTTPKGSFSRFKQDIGHLEGHYAHNGEWKFDTAKLQTPRYEKDAQGNDVVAKDENGDYIFDDVLAPDGNPIFLPTNKIEAIKQQNATFYVLWKVDCIKKDGTYDTTKVGKFKSDPGGHATYSFYYQQPYDVSAIWSAYDSWASGIATGILERVGDAGADEDLKKLVATVQNATTPIEVDSSAVKDSIFSLTNIINVVLIAFAIFVVIFLIRSFSNRGGLGNMGRNRATVTMGGAVRFADVAGIEEEKEEVQEIVQFLRNPSKFLELGARIPKGVLLVGPPGTGKTLLAKAIAGEAKVHFFSISGSDFSEMLVGVGPSRMRDLFEQAKANAPAIIFIDEIDSIARMRGVGVSGVSDENEQTLNQLLVQMDGFTKSEGVIVIAATNRPDVLDQALLRPGRFDRQIVVQMPDVKGREQILKVHAKGKPLGSDVDLKRVAQIISGFSGADIENLLNEAAIIAAKKDKKKINMSDITEGINKVLLGPQKRSRIITDADKKITAYHEAGHAIVSRVLQPDQTVQEVSIIPRGMAAGYTLTNEKDIESTHKSRTILNAHLAVFMAGRVAEQMFVGDICTGCSNDLKVATNLAERMVTEFGMSEKLGPLFFGKEQEMALRLYNAQNPHSEQLQALIDSEVKTLILNAEKSAQDILKALKAKVDVMAGVLLERETIYAADIALIMEGKSVKAVITEMEKRDKQAREQEQKDKIEADLAALERDLEHIMYLSQSFVAQKLANESVLEKLKANMELARSVVRSGAILTHLPTLDNLEIYATMVTPKKEEAPSKPAKKPAVKKKTTESKTNEKT